MLGDMKIGSRSVSKVLRATTEGQHYRALANMLIKYEQPAEALRRYLLGTGQYPHTFHIRMRNTLLHVKAYTYYDLLTINEIFCRIDYPCPDSARTIVDFGSNIGISALFFLSAAPTAHLFLFEPVPRNIERLRDTLSNYRGRYTLKEAAVGVAAGTVSFGVEETGRYGGITRESENRIQVDCVAAVETLNSILEQRETIDILKMDIEGFEDAVLAAIPKETAERIKTVYAETDSNSNPLSATHKFERRGSIGVFRNIRP